MSTWRSTSIVIQTAFIRFNKRPRCRTTHPANQGDPLEGTLLSEHLPRFTEVGKDSPFFASNASVLVKPPPPGSSRGQGQFQNERGAESRAFAVRHKRAANLPCGEGAAVQAEAVAVFSRGETKAENAREIFRGDSDAVIGNGNAQSLVAGGEADDELFVRARRHGAGVSRVADEIDEDLQHFVLVDADDGQIGLVFAQHPNL